MSDNSLRYKTLVDFSRIVSVFENRGGQAQERSMSEIARSLDMLPSKASRMLAVLEAEGLVEKNPTTGKYWIGPRFLGLGILYLHNHPLRQIILPHVEQTASDLGIICSWGVFTEHRVVVIDRVIVNEGPPIRLIGLEVPLHASAYGKLFCAYLSDNELNEVVGVIDFVRFTASTIADPIAFKEECAGVRERGYAVDEGESRENVLAIACPIFRGSGEICAAIMGAWWASDMRIDRAKATAYLAEKAAFISRQLGYGSG